MVFLLMVIIYARVSTGKQKDNYSFGDQRKDGVSFSQSIKQPYTVYKDVESGFSATRPGWIDFLKAVEKATSEDTVFFEAQDRLSRDPIEFELFKRLAVKVKVKVYENSKKSYIDYSEFGTDLVTTVLSKVAEGEAKKTKGRTYKGLKASWNAGYRTYNKLYGYESVSFDKETGKKVWTVVPKEAEIIHKVFSLYLEGKGPVAIAKTLNKAGFRNRSGYFKDSVCFHMLRQPIYCGYSWDENYELVPSKVYPAIIPRKVFDKVERTVHVKHIRQMGRPPVHMGSGILRCAKCKSKMYFHEVRQFGYYLHKANTGCNGIKLRKLEPCEYILEHAYGSALLFRPDNFLKEMKENMQESDNQLSEDISRVSILIIKAETERDKFVKALESEEQTEFWIEKVNAKSKEIDKLKMDKEQMKTSLSVKALSFEELQASYGIENLTKFFEIKNTQERGNMLKTIIKNAWVKDKRITVDFIIGESITYDYRQILLSKVWKGKRSMSMFYGNPNNILAGGSKKE